MVANSPGKRLEESETDLFCEVCHLRKSGVFLLKHARLLSLLESGKLELEFCAKLHLEHLASRNNVINQDRPGSGVTNLHKEGIYGRTT